MSSRFLSRAAALVLGTALMAAMVFMLGALCWSRVAGARKPTSESIRDRYPVEARLRELDLRALELVPQRRASGYMSKT